jgi:fido (protein-threonine AMPylation protein)
VDPDAMTIEDVEDHVRTYTAAEDERLAHQLRAITEDCHAGKLWPVSIDMLRSMHRRLFDGVRDHAGRFRERAFGNEHLTFGPNRSVHRDAVLTQIEGVFRSLDRSVQSFLAHPDAPEYEPSAVHVAVWAHAEVVRIHPFLDGNGRSSRLLMNAVLVGLGLQPIAVEAVKQEYNEALNHYFRTRDLQLLVDLMLRLVD